MHRLAVPSVELYAKKHALEQKTKIKISSNKSTKRLLKEISYQKQLLEIESLVDLEQTILEHIEICLPACLCLLNAEIKSMCYHAGG